MPGWIIKAEPGSCISWQVWGILWLPCPVWTHRDGSWISHQEKCACSQVKAQTFNAFFSVDSLLIIRNNDLVAPCYVFFSSGVSSACSASKNSTRSQKQNVFTSSTSTALVATLQICRFSANLGHQWMIIKCSIYSGDLQGAERGVVGPEQQCHCEQVSAFLPRVQRNHRCCIRVNPMHTLNWFLSGESRYNLADLLSAPPPLESEEESPVYKESEEVTLASWTHVLITFHQMKRLQQKMSKVYLRQQAKGGIIDLEEEGRRMLVVTRGEQEENLSGTEFTELSPTDYQLGRQHFPIAPENQILSKIVSEFRALLVLPASPLHRRSSRKKDNGRGDGKDMQVKQ